MFNWMKSKKEVEQSKASRIKEILDFAEEYNAEVRAANDKRLERAEFDLKNTPLKAYELTFKNGFVGKHTVHFQVSSGYNPYLFTSGFSLEFNGAARAKGISHAELVGAGVREERSCYFYVHGNEDIISQIRTLQYIKLDDGAMYSSNEVFSIRELL